MPLIANGVVITDIVANGTEILKVIANGTQVFNNVPNVILTNDTVVRNPGPVWTAVDAYYGFFGDGTSKWGVDPPTTDTNPWADKLAIGGNYEVKFTLSTEVEVLYSDYPPLDLWLSLSSTRQFGITRFDQGDGTSIVSMIVSIREKADPTNIGTGTIIVGAMVTS